MILPRRGDFRDASRYAVALASEMAAPLLRRAAHFMVPAPPTPPSAWRSGLIIGHGHIGDVLYRTCSLDALARGLPKCRWTYLTTRTGAQVLRDNPALNGILSWMDGVNPESLARPRIEHLRARRYDVVLCTESVRHHTALQLALRMKVPNRVGFAHKGLSGLMTYPVSLRGAMSRPAQFRAMVDAITETTTDDPLRPRVYPGDADRAAADIAWKLLGYDPGTPVIACSVTTRQAHGKVPPAFFARVLRDIAIRRPDIQIALCGTLEDGTTLRTIADIVGARAKLVVGELSILGYAAFLAKCRAFLGSDSGPRHLANAAGIPVVFVRNLASAEVEAGTYCETEWDAAPHGSYLSEPAIASALERVNPSAVATRLIAMMGGD